MTSIKVAYTVNGRHWEYVDNGAIYQTNSDGNSKVAVNFKTPVYARGIRIYPISWSNHIAMRFEVKYFDILI